MNQRILLSFIAVVVAIAVGIFAFGDPERDPANTDTTPSNVAPSGTTERHADPVRANAPSQPPLPVTESPALAPPRSSERSATPPSPPAASEAPAAENPSSPPTAAAERPRRGQPSSDNRVPDDAPSRFPADTEALRDGIRGGFSELRPQLRECYEPLLDLSPEAEDRLRFHLRVTAESAASEFGTIELEAISTETLEIEDTACFAEVIDELRLPPPEGGNGYYAVTYPVVLSTDAE